MVQMLPRCPACGLPGKLAESLEWRSDGAIILRRLRPLRLALLDSRTMIGIRDGVVSALGREAYIKALREAARPAQDRSAGATRSGLPRYGAAKKEVLEAIETHAVLLGMGRVEVERFTPLEGGSFILRSPFEATLIATGVAAILEEIDGCRYAWTLCEAGGDLFRLELGADRSESTEGEPGFGAPGERKAPQGPRGGGGCRLCGLPVTISWMRWDELYGTVTAGAGGRRVSLVPSCALDAWGGRRAKGESGERRRLMEDEVYKAARESLGGGAGDAYEGPELLPAGGEAGKAWESMHMRGWGTVISDRLYRGSWLVEVLNPVSEALIAGWLRALYTVAEGREPLLKVKEEAASSVFEMS